MVPRGPKKLLRLPFLNIRAAHPIEGYRREDRDVRSDNLIYILVVIILVLVALLLLSQLI
jgi:hypothetical protein